jgi:hypothetical protein
MRSIFCPVCKQKFKTTPVAVLVGPKLMALLFKEVPKGNSAMMFTCGDTECVKEIETGDWIVSRGKDKAAK